MLLQCEAILISLRFPSDHCRFHPLSFCPKLADCIWSGQGIHSERHTWFILWYVCLNFGIFSKVHLVITIFFVYKGLISATAQIRSRSVKRSSCVKDFFHPHLHYKWSLPFLQCKSSLKVVWTVSIYTALLIYWKNEKRRNLNRLRHCLLY